MSCYLCTNVFLRLFTLFLISLSFLSCERIVEKNVLGPAVKDTIVIRDTIIIRDTVVKTQNYNWQKGFGLTHDENKDSIDGRPLEYYISDPECSALAFDFYYSNFRPQDNASTAELLELVLTDNNKLRPFYRWCLDMTIKIADGALAEYPGTPALNYVLKYPEEFFQFIDKGENPYSYSDWVSIINYSGLDKFDYDASVAYEEIKKEMSKNCLNCNQELLGRINTFALQVSGKEEKTTELDEEDGEKLPGDQ